MGDAAGVGPEIISKALSLKEIYEVCKPVVIGDSKVMEQAVKIAKVDLKVNPIRDLREAVFEHGTIDVVDLRNIELNKLVMGKVNAMAGKASVDYIKKAVALALSDAIKAIVTAPISKEAINKAGYHYSGHTELLADLTKTRDYTMMLIAGPLRVTHVTTHMSLREACNKIRRERIYKVIKLTDKALREMEINDPRIAVAGLNPHCGEGGLFGREEIEEIKPAVETARKEGINVVGPLPADTVFVRAKGGAYDAVVAMYHDQGHIPVKMLGLEWDEKRREWTRVSGVNITIGLPIIRTSVDHGTAFGKAGKGTANPQSMIEAIKLAAKMAASRLQKAQE
ncbi:4-hydroxythreonine-4-phosphate dehydrogenase PdxA [Candidatus Bathyarchaeota archaeon]|nr:4-hydroxythreonine-4-phosphate dehydrogenase PdxA [Candidatus Bathyarchaeota archaeon]